MVLLGGLLPLTVYDARSKRAAAAVVHPAPAHRSDGDRAAAPAIRRHHPVAVGAPPRPSAEPPRNDDPAVPGVVLQWEGRDVEPVPRDGPDVVPGEPIRLRT